MLLRFSGSFMGQNYSEGWKCRLASKKYAYKILLLGWRKRFKVINNVNNIILEKYLCIWLQRRNTLRPNITLTNR